MTMIVIEQNATLRRNNPRQVRSKDGAVSTERNPSRDMIRLYRRRRVPLTASTAPPCASITVGGRERANLTRPRRARITAATLSRSITILHFPHQSLRSSLLSDWSLSPHLGQVMLDPLVSRLDSRMTESPIHLALYSNCCWA